MKILTSHVRKVAGREEFRMKLVYQTANGVTKMQSLLFSDRPKAEKTLAFRVAGLNNGGRKVS